MAQFAMCSRASMYQTCLTLAKPAGITTPTADACDAMATPPGDSQVKKPKQRRPRSSKSKYTPFDYAAAKDPATATPAVGLSWAELQAESSHLFPGPEPTSSSATVRPLPSQPNHHSRNNARKGTRKNNRQRAKNKSNTNVTHENMAGPPDIRYIPPHLRNRNITPASTVDKPDTEPGGCAIEQSPGVSAPSEKEKHDDSQPQHTGTGQVETPPSPPTTVEKEPVVDERQDNEQKLPQDPESIYPLVKDRKSRKLDEYEVYNEMASAGKIDEWALYEKTGYIMPHKEYPPGGNPRWPRTKAWPKAREMRPLPSENDDQGGVHVKSDSEGDPFYDIKKIVDWNGDFLPPPECWAERARYTNRHPAQEIWRWIEFVPRQCEMTMKIETAAFTSGPFDEKGAILNKELAPKYWIPEKVEGDPVRIFLAQLPSRAPPALSDMCDTDSPIPWWERYNDCPADCFLEAPPAPEAKIDLNDTENELECPYAMLSTTERLRKLKVRAQEKERRRLARLNRPVAPVVVNPPAPDLTLRPKANFYIRPIQPADVRGIMEIYNHYVTTISATEFDPCTEAEIRNRCDAVVNANLPFFVAVAKNHRPKSRTGYLSERIIGYINLKDSGSQSSMYRFTFDLELFIDPGYVRQGIGKCLLDQMIDYAHPRYPARGGYEYVNEYDYLKTGLKRIIKTILVSHHYEEDENVSWVSDYLRPFGFSRAGNLYKIGYKNGKVVNRVMYQQQTAERINAHIRPVA